MSKTQDKSIDLLINQLALATGQWLVVADENWPQTIWGSINNSQQRTVIAMTNRIDIAAAAQLANINCQFNDFDFSELSPASFDGVIYRVSKERATSHHIINQAAKLLKPKATLMLAGEKNDGIKTYVKQAGKLFANPVNAEKNGKAYIATIELNAATTDELNDKNYSQLRPVRLCDDFCLQSKPGIFGWDKIDRGSAFLIDHLPQFLSSYKNTPQSLLDLGCGYGYIAFCASQFGFNRIVATDNNAAALLAIRENLISLNNIEWQAIAADAGDGIEEQFDTILCNPPFHSGFSIDDQLGIKFLRQTKRLLKHSGRALFVVNGFIPLEHKAKAYFEQVEILANNGSFKLISLKK
ncbi:MAG: methyltransferase [Porticoccaceae bacterium]|jgi:16S rRNA (guanine1207-N2)-methyltransferase